MKELTQWNVKVSNDNYEWSLPPIFELGSASGISLDRGERTESPHTPHSPVAPITIKSRKKFNWRRVRAWFGF